MKRLALLQLLLQLAPLSALVTGGPVVDLVLLTPELQLVYLLLFLYLLGELQPHPLNLVHLRLLFHLSLLGELHDLLELRHFLAAGIGT